MSVYLQGCLPTMNWLTNYLTLQGHQSLQLHFKSKFGHEGEVLVTHKPLAAGVYIITFDARYLLDF